MRKSFILFISALFSLAGDAKGAAKDEVSNVVTNSIREGIRGLFR
jgi:hypothetical protein